MMFRRTGARGKPSEQGYILLLLMLFITLLAIAATAIAPSIAFQIRRDREEEMIHRGVQYSRAIRRYVKKFGRYPTRMEDLENSSNLRFLRRRYKDPITGKDFKLLHLGEVQMAFGAGLAGANPAGGVQGVPTLGGALMNSGGVAGLQNGLNTNANANANANPNPNPQATPASGGTADSAGAGGAGADQDAGDAKAKVTATAANAEEHADKLSTQVFGGGPIVGVASISKDKTIREFNHKNHYNQWQFIYDPSTDRGGLLNTPAQPALQGAGVGQPIGGQLPGVGLAPGQANPNPGATGSPFSNNPQAPNPQSPQDSPPPQSPPQQQ